MKTPVETLVGPRPAGWPGDELHDDLASFLADEAARLGLVVPGTRELPVGPSGPVGDVLHRVALVANSSLDLDELLAKLAQLALEAIPADRCNLWLFDDEGVRLSPALSVDRHDDAPIVQRFRELRPIHLDQIPARWRAVFEGEGRAFGIPDTAASPLVPKGFPERFKSRAALVMPLMAGTEKLGVLSLDWSGGPRAFRPDEFVILEAIGGYATLAIRNARLYGRLAAKARSLEKALHVAGALNASAPLPPVLELICSAFEELLGATHCSINMVELGAERAEVRTLVMSGASWPTATADGVHLVRTREQRRVRDRWAVEPEPVVYPVVDETLVVDASLIPPEVRSAVAYPLVHGEKLIGYLVAGFGQRGGPGADLVETGRVLAAQAATAITRALLHDRLRQRVQQLEILYRLSDVVAGTNDLAGALRGLNRALRREMGVHLESLSVANAQVRATLGAPAPSAADMEAVRSWRATIANGRRALRPRRSGDLMLVPVVHGRRVQGVLRVRVLPDAAVVPDDDLLMALGSGCAEVVHRAGLSRALAESERRLAIMAERERIARDLHDSAGQVFTGLGMQLAGYAHEAPDQMWRERLETLARLAARGSQEVRQAIHSLLFLDVRRNGLPSSLKELAAKFEATTGIVVRLSIRGEPYALVPDKEDALFRVVHEALMNAERHARAALVSIVLQYGDGDVLVSIRDDGVGLAHRDPFDVGGTHFGLRAMQRRMEESGGELTVSNARPHGVLVRARVGDRPGRKQRTERASGSSRRR